ncbi:MULTISPECIES: hypothetical protein [Thermodesulfovibrio]|jgi:hypothetical protein|uniref:hypothetical protein n=1 Tax=Thermodesulfovibrio TaxID=28261 RepID=UPI00262808A3|nr:hypothetical protein [Thermodesulfovibrio sp.]
MKALILKSFNLYGREFKKDEVTEIPVSAFNKLSLKGLVKPYLPDVSEDELPFLKAEFEKIYAEHIQRLSEMPLTASIIKELYPELYQKLRELEVKMDEAWLTFDYEAFTEALRDIEEIMQVCFIHDEG